MRHSSRLACLLTLCLACLLTLCLACTNDPTQVMVVVQSNIPVPAEMDEVRIDVEGLGTQPVAVADLRTRGLPRTLALLHQGGPLGPIFVNVTGYLGDAPVVTRRAEFMFRRGEARALYVTLLRSCVGQTCDAALTCTEVGCESVEVQDLPPWTGDVVLFDSGLMDAGLPDATIDSPMIDAPIDSPIDAPVDAGVDAVLDAPDAGCVCPPLEDIPQAVDCVGECVLTCDPERADCDGFVATGCEADLTRKQTCGDCDTRCPGPSACVEMMCT